MRAQSRSLLTAVLALILTSCGYHFQGAGAPQAAIEIPIFKNRTVETGIEAVVTDRIIQEIRRTPGWRVVPPGRGQYILRGVIRTFRSGPRLISGRRLSVENRAVLVLDVRLYDRKKRGDLWKVPSLESFEDYPVGADILQNERRKAEAIAVIASRLAERIRVRIQDTW